MTTKIVDTFNIFFCNTVKTINSGQNEHTLDDVGDKKYQVLREIKKCEDIQVH